MTLLKLSCPVQHYEWGERASSGRIPLIAELQNGLPGDLPWAELWMGAHPAASSVIEESGKSLCNVIIEERQAMVGSRAKLPFLLKVLCCSRPLSIQSHPDLKSAVRLHSLYPKDFPDDNHKPEVLYALEPFSLLAGFRPLQEAISEFRGRAVLGQWASLLEEAGDYSLLCRHILTMDTSALADAITEIGKSLDSNREHDVLFAEISSLYPADCGTLFTYLLNYMHLKAGEAVFVPANTPHAYLSGRGIECMASSDNVIRAGLTPKTVRRDLLLETLDFAPSSPEAMLAPNAEATGFFIDRSPDFKLSIVKGNSAEHLLQGGTPAVICVLDGAAELRDEAGAVKASKGEVYFKPAVSACASIKGLESNALLAIAEA